MAGTPSDEQTAPERHGRRSRQRKTDAPQRAVNTLDATQQATQTTASAATVPSRVTNGAAPTSSTKSHVRRTNSPLVSTLPAPSPTPTSTSTSTSTSTRSASNATGHSANARVRRARPRESNISGLGERARFNTAPPLTLPLPDPLLVTLPAMRQALLNRPLDEGVRVVAEGLVAVFAPALAQVWIADPTPWTSEQNHVGAQQLTPTLRPRASARATSRSRLGLDPSSASSGESDSTETQARLPLRADPLIAEVITDRHSIVIFDADDQPLAREWLGQMPIVPTLTPMPINPTSSAQEPSRALGTLAAYPLRARGQFLGVLALGTGQRLTPRQLGALEELSDLAALAADRDRLLSYSRGQEALAQTVVRHATVAIAALTGPEHTFALANPAFDTLLGLESAVELVGRRLTEIVPERAQRLALTLRLDAVFESGEPQAMIELPIHHRDRGITYWNVTSSPLPGIATSVGGVLVAAVDVTRQVLSRQRAQDAADIAQERIGQMMTLHATSLAVASQLGADPRELLDDILRRSIALLDARAGAVYVRDSRHNTLEVIVCQGLRGDYVGNHIHIGEGLAGQVALTSKGRFIDDYRTFPNSAAMYDGEVFGAEIAVPLIQRGQVVGVLEVLDDPERRAFTDDDLWLLDLFAAQAAQAIENARTYVELESAYRKQRDLDRMKDDFIATASHELRTPLTGVQGFLDLLLDYPGSRDDELALEFLTKASESAQELAEIAERLLQTSRLDTGRIELHIVPVRLAQVVDEVLRSFRDLQAAQGQTHDLLADVAPDIYIQADLGRLKEVIENLVSNAIKYSPKGGQVHVRCQSAATSLLISDRADIQDIQEELETPNEVAAIEERPTMVLPHLTAEVPDPENDPSVPMPALLAAAQGQPYLIITVSDQGMGIPSAERSRLFGRFSRLDSARDSQIRGTGLGLYICRQIVRTMGGDVWLRESVPGQGSSFAFALPAAPGATLVSASTAEASLTQSLSDVTW